MLLYIPVYYTYSVLRLTMIRVNSLINNDVQTSQPGSFEVVFPLGDVGPTDISTRVSD